MMVRLNEAKPEDYMRPLDVPGGRKQNPHARKAQTPREPGRVSPREFESRPVHH
jgi:hypothetical protein